MRRTGGWQAQIADRKGADSRQDMLPVCRLGLRSVEEDRTDFFMRAKEALKVICGDGACGYPRVQAADSRTGLQHIPECDSGSLQFM